MLVQKRDGSFQELQISKIQRVLLMAFQGSSERPDVMPLVHRVMGMMVSLEEPVDVERVSDTVESVLAAAGWVDVARAFMRHRLERDRVRAERLSPDKDAISDYIHVGKYARYVKERRELPDETIRRDEDMHIARWPELEGEIRSSFSYVYEKMGVPSMRSMQFGGEAILRDNARIYNCSFGHLSRWRAFQEMFYLLLCGCGVGYSVQWQHVEKLSELVRVDHKNVCHYTIDDSIKGWADSLGYLLESYRVGCYVEFDYSQIRAEGELLITSGGRAPGHLPLKKCLEAVRHVLNSAQGRKLRPLEAHDIMCHMALAVLAGGIRRSAMIALFSPEDTEMIYAKASGNFRPAGAGGDPGHNAQREMANNSACLLRETAVRETFVRLLRVANENYGCPGFFFTDNLDYGPNPCGEIGMWPMIGWCCNEYCSPAQQHKCGEVPEKIAGISFCNLTEVNCAASRNEDDLLDSIKAMTTVGTLQAAYTSFPYLGEVTEAIVKRESLLGVSLTGIMDNRELVLDAGRLRRAADVAITENVRMSKLLGINPAARVTTVKPSGTASLWLGGVGSGIHPRWARRYFQRVTANSLEPQAVYFKKINPHMIEVKPNGDWCIVFPIESSDNAVTVKDWNAMEFLDAVFLVYENWILGGTAIRDSAPGLTHNVSCTVTVKDTEVEDVIERIWKERHRVAAMSFAPYLIDQKFAFAPRQAITVENEARWNHLISLYKKIDWSLFREENDTTSLSSEAACAGGVCEL